MQRRRTCKGAAGHGGGRRVEAAVRCQGLPPGARQALCFDGQQRARHTSLTSRRQIERLQPATGQRQIRRCGPAGRPIGYRAAGRGSCPRAARFGARLGGWLRF